MTPEELLEVLDEVCPRLTAEIERMRRHGHYKAYGDDRWISSADELAQLTTILEGARYCLRRDGITTGDNDR